MMKLAVTALTLTLALNLSQAKTSGVAQAQEFPQHSALKNRTQMKNVLARVVPRTRRQLLITDDVTDDGPAGPDELDLHTLYRRPRITEHGDVDTELSEYVTVRLALARAKAMSKYREQQTQL